MNMLKPLSVLVLSNYMICPPISGGAKRMLFPLTGFDKECPISFTYLYMSYSEAEVAKNKKYLESFSNVDRAIGVLVQVEFMFNKENLVDDFPRQAWDTMSKDYLNILIKELKATDYDIIQVEHTQFSWVVPFLREHSNAKIVLNHHNIEHMVYERWLKFALPQDRREIQKNYETLKAWETKVLPWFDAVFCISPIEEKMIRKQFPNLNTYFVPSGAAIDDDLYYPKNEIAEKKYDMFFIGTMEWFPNAHALIWMLDEVMPLILKQRPETNLQIVGSGQPDSDMLNRIKRYPNVTFWGSIKDEIPLFHNSKVFVSPIWIGAGVRLKNPTAWAAKTPVVATSLSVEGLNYTDGKDLLIADTPQDFANSVLRLLDDASLRKGISDQAHKTYKDNYANDRLANISVSAYMSVVETAPPTQKAPSALANNDRISHAKLTEPPFSIIDNVYPTDLGSKHLIHEIRKNAVPGWSSDEFIDYLKSMFTEQYSDSEDELKELFYRAALTYDRQTMIFYIDCLPHFWEHFLHSGGALWQEYTLLDIGPRTGAGANLFGELFYDAVWGYAVNIKIDTTDIEDVWNSYCKMQPFISNVLNVDIFDMADNSYDFVFCSHTIEHLDEPFDFIRKSTKIAKRFALFYCPYNEKDPPEYHRIINKKTISQVKPVYVKHINSAAYPTPCVLFICDKNSLL